MGQFEAAVRGLSDACRELEIPVVSGNVSFYNETDGRAIPPTPTVGMVGLLEDVENRVRLPFRREGDVVALLGETRDELGGSEFLRVVKTRDEGPCPELDLAAEKRLVELLVALAQGRILASAHDLSEGGLAVAAAECAMKSGLGVEIRLEEGIRPSALLFGETPGRVLVTADPSNRSALTESAGRFGVPCQIVGTVGGPSLRIAAGTKILLEESVSSLSQLWSTAFARAMESADVL
jgi:phosphoribosylformylglycinamidine synthase